MRISTLLASGLFLGSIFAAPARAVPPAAPVSSGAALGVSSITWTWSASAGATGYRILSSTDPGANISGDLPPTSSSFTVTGFSTNTANTLTVEAFNGSGTADAPASTVFTAAAAPTGTRLLGTSVNAVSLSWQANGNPVGTVYDVVWSSAGGAAIHFSTQPAVIAGTATATVVDLPGSGSVSFKVRALNGDSVPTGYDAAVSTSLPAIWGQPTLSSASFAVGTASITWYWSASTGAVGYQLFSATNGAVSPPLPATAHSYTQTGLSPNSFNLDYVAAYSATSSTNSAPLGVYTLAAPTTALTLLTLDPANARETLSWGANGNAAGTVYDVKWWTDVTSTITVSSAATSAVIPFLPGGGTIYFTVQALNGSGFPSDFDVTKTTSFPTSTRSVPAGYSGILSFATPSALVTLRLTSGTFASDVTISVSSPTGVVPGLGPGQSAVSPQIAVQITAQDSFLNALQPRRVMALQIGYLPGSLGALPSGQVSLARHDDARGVWVPLDTLRSGNSLLAMTDHLSTFMVLGVSPPGDLSSISVGPNPLRPLLVSGQLMTFRGLPSGARVRILTYLGERVANLSADASGTVAWDGRNASGSFVASGVYIAAIEASGVKKLMRVAVER